MSEIDQLPLELAKALVERGLVFVTKEGTIIAASWEQAAEFAEVEGQMVDLV
jgi:hypothetical protein